MIATHHSVHEMEGKASAGLMKLLVNGLGGTNMAMCMLRPLLLAIQFMCRLSLVLGQRSALRSNKDLYCSTIRIWGRLAKQDGKLVVPPKQSFGQHNQVWQDQWPHWQSIGICRINEVIGEWIGRYKHGDVHAATFVASNTIHVQVVFGLGAAICFEVKQGFVLFHNKNLGTLGKARWKACCPPKTIIWATQSSLARSVTLLAINCLDLSYKKYLLAFLTSLILKAKILPNHWLWYCRSQGDVNVDGCVVKAKGQVLEREKRCITKLTNDNLQVAFTSSNMVL